MPFQITTHAVFVHYVPVNGEDAILKVTDANGRFYFLESQSEGNDEAYYRFPSDLIPMHLLNEMYENAARGGRPLFNVQEAREIVQNSFMILPIRVTFHFTQLVLSSNSSSWTSAPVISVEEVTRMEAIEMWFNDRGSSLG